MLLFHAITLRLNGVVPPITLSFAPKTDTPMPFPTSPKPVLSRPM
jgi:hypothetical protein